MTSERHVHHWRPESSEAPSERPVERLEEALRPLADDRASTAQALVREASLTVDAWVRTKPDDWVEEAGAEELERGLDAFREAHAWRAPVARWLSALARVVELRGVEDGRTADEVRPAAPPLREVLGEELGLWLGGADDEPETAGSWDGEPLTAGVRLPDRDACATRAIEDVMHGEVIAVHGYSETVALGLQRLQEQGRWPEIIASEGGPDLGGRRLARRLAERGLRVELVYDAALFAALGRCDRIWIGTESVGESDFVARVGTGALLAEARRRGVRSTLLATSDKWMPDGRASVPDWCAREHWLLWESAPEGVLVDSQAFELVRLEAIDAIVDERRRRATSNHWDADPSRSLRPHTGQLDTAHSDSAPDSVAGHTGEPSAEAPGANRAGGASSSNVYLVPTP